MAKLWQKPRTKLHPKIEKYTVGDDYIIDQALMPFDIQASKAHAKQLQKIKILTHKELSCLLSALTQLEKTRKQGRIKIKIQDEDCHTVIENYLIKKLGNTGKKIHTGRSRNDQSLAALRLYMKKSVKDIMSQGMTLSKTLLSFAKKYQKIPMPGYSHTQQAMLTTVGHYFASFMESLLDDLEFLRSVEKHIDKNPLGSAAGFGAALPLDRKFTTKELGFAKTQINSLYCQNSRGKFESVFLEGLSQIMLTLGKLANDLVLFTSQEFDFFAVDSSLTTGSSLMPQKKNMDALEIIRGYASVVLANHQMTQNISKGLMSGYNRDFQLIKKPLIESVNITQDSLEIMNLFVKNIKPKEKSIKQKIKKEIFAADMAAQLACQKNIPFRDAYNKALDELAKHDIDMQKNIAAKISLGGPGNMGWERYNRILRACS